MKQHYNLYGMPSSAVWDTGHFLARYAGEVSRGQITMPLILENNKLALGQDGRIVCPYDSVLNSFRIERGTKVLPRFEVPTDLPKRMAMLLLGHSRLCFGDTTKPTPINGCYETSRGLEKEGSRISKEFLTIQNTRTPVRLKVVRKVSGRVRDDNYKNEIHTYLGWGLAGIEVYLRLSKHHKMHLIAEATPPMLRGLGIYSEKSFLEWVGRLPVSHDVHENQKNAHLFFIHTKDSRSQTIAGYEAVHDVSANKRPALWAVLDRNGFKIRIRYGDPRDLAETYLKGILHTFMKERMHRNGDLPVNLFR